MTTKPRRRKRSPIAQQPIREEPVKRQDPHLENIVRQAVLEQLGKPPRLNKVRCHNVFDNRWRVNVWTEYDGGVEMVYTSHRIEHSYFCRLSDDGEVTCDPPVERLY